MVRSFLVAAAIAISSASATFATDINEMTDSERESFRAEVRAYLLDNPEVLMEAIAVLEQKRAESAATADIDMIENNRNAIFNDGVSYVGGNLNGDITIVEFLDYQCGYCKRAFPAVEELINSDGNIRFIVKEFPILGEASVMASRYALAVKSVYGDAAYKTVHDELMLLRGGPTPQTLARLSEELDLDHDAIRDEMENPAIEQLIAANRDLAQRLQIQGTPSFIMGESFVRGFIELEQMRQVIANERRDQG